MRGVGASSVVLMVAVLLVGCGSAYSKRDFIARADAICASTVRELRSLPPPSFSGSGGQRLRALSRYLAGVSPLVDAEAEQIRALQRPDASTGDRAVLASFLAALASAAADYGQLLSAARRGDDQGVARAEAALRESRVGALAERYGLRSCAGPGATVA